MKTSKLINGTLESDYGITFPMTWNKKSIEWATEHKLTQTVVDEIEYKLGGFRYKRDYYQAISRLRDLPQLRAAKVAFKCEIDALKAEVERMGVKQTKGLPWAALSAALHHNHKREGLAGQVVEIGWKLQEVTGQLAMIEGDKYMMALMAQIESEAA